MMYHVYHDIIYRETIDLKLLLCKSVHYSNNFDILRMESAAKYIYTASTNKMENGEKCMRVTKSCISR